MCFSTEGLLTLALPKSCYWGARQPLHFWFGALKLVLGTPALSMATLGVSGLRGRGKRVGEKSLDSISPVSYQADVWCLDHAFQ